jgi:hypothetical protein
MLQKTDTWGENLFHFISMDGQRIDATLNVTRATTTPCWRLIWVFLCPQFCLNDNFYLDETRWSIFGQARGYWKLWRLNLKFVIASKKSAIEAIS